jgi:hypothetical protein
MKHVAVLAFLFAAATLAPAQSVAALKKELRAKEADAKKDVGAMLGIAEWAGEKGLVSDRRRILNAILKLDPENEKAHEMLGFVKYEGEWVTKAKAEMAIRKALEAEMKAKGMVEVDGVWVTKDEEKDAKAGIFRHEGELVSRADKVALAQGMVRHRVTGQFISATDAAKADEGLFPLGGDKWGTEAEADEFHSKPETPWVYRTYHATLVTHKPLSELKTIAADLDSAITSVGKIFGGAEPNPDQRPVVIIAQDDDQFRALGNAVGAEGSAYGVFLAQGDVEIPGLGVARPVIMNWSKDWGPYWVRHAGGFGFAVAIEKSVGEELPLWFTRGVGGYAERHYTPGVASFFGKQHLQKGGVQALESWFERFEISGNIETRMLDFNIYQGGLVLDFAMSGTDDGTTKAMQEVTKAAFEGKGLAKAVMQLQKTVGKQEDAVRDHLRKVTSI